MRPKTNVASPAGRRVHPAARKAISLQLRRPAAKFKPTQRTNVPETARERVPAWLIAVLLIGVTIAAYWPATHHDFVNYDDNLYVLENSHVTGGFTREDVRWAFVSGHAANWHPLTWLSHMLDCQLYGVKPWGHHFTSVLFHAFNAALVFVLLRQLTGAIWPSLCVAAFFALHPLRVESVAWIAERKDVLSGFFGLLALLFYVRYAARRQSAKGSESQTPPVPASAARRSSGDFGLALFFLALGLMSKPMLVTWPFVMLLLDFWPLNRVPLADRKQQVPALKRLLIEKLPFFALAALACVVTFCVQKSGGAVGSPPPLGARVANALISFFRYLQKLFWPANLAVFYPLPDRWPFELVLAALGLLLSVSAVLWVKRRPYPFMLVGWLWFAGTLIPVLGLVQVGQQSMADRYTYLPSIGVFLLVVWGACELAGRWRYHRMALLIAGSTALVLCAGLTREQLACWQNSEVLFQHALKVTDNNYLAHNNLGAALAEKGQLEEAIAQFREAIRLNPDYAEFYYHLGNALGIRGRIDETIAPLQEAIRLKPDYAEAHNDLGMALATKGRMDEAINEFREAIRLKPGYADPHNHLGAALSAQGRVDEAILQFQEALRLNPDFAEVHNKLGSALSLKGQTEQAILHFREAVRLRPDYAKARYNLAVALVSKGQLDEAIGHFQEVVRLRPGDAAARKNLDDALVARFGSSKQSTPPTHP